mmetsp:Transcript_38441/g.53530  ORF Transcript_38441/g.53530 Transcript_38441/m.53530 type:complete len:255 (+) Transcript_38441:140-904(+)|eukprot:CAMPEP_0201491692 /NCGR_PEP_ID=MMETSP0151_2-20130828/30827_1 /ASSEMBLY_ACC=CAM_ASM_000257 /TAXON_ID=200890 /ORGANISM="Paramoeba atlantica, Strain 621/1 / CCAP 1560/9" /LENGTH=254 /DNA_ID=CAMNT_0047878167 /DNA_START=139 /DNA_END=903 /DNA_ORIENTATION=-
MAGPSREELLFKAKLADNAERFDEMADIMQQVGVLGVELTPEERNLFSVACKNSISTRRASLRILSSIESKEKQKSDQCERRIEMIRDYQKKVEEELQRLCQRIITILDKNLIPSTKERENRVFFYKIQGDYYRYLAEFLPTIKEDSEPVAGALNAYEKASEHAKELLPTNPIVLGLALNFSVFCYEILQSPERACIHAKNAFDAALARLPNSSKDEYHDAAVIMKLVKDNLILWTSDFLNDSDSEGEEEKSES